MSERLKMEPKTIALAFPGQGRQEAGIGMDVIGNPQFPQANLLFRYGSQLLKDILNKDLDVADICKNNPGEILNIDSEIAQPVLTLVYLTRYTAWKESHPQEPEPDVITAHSLGKLAALVIANSITFKQALELSAFRGKYTKSAAQGNPGTMGYLIDMEELILEEVCQKVRQNRPCEFVGISSINGPRELVISGTTSAVQEALDTAANLPVGNARRVGPLPIPYPSHSPLMEEAKQAFGTIIQLAKIKPPETTLVFNGRIIKPQDGQLALTAIRSILSGELTQKVSWPQTDSVLRDPKIGVGKLTEIGAQPTKYGTLAKFTAQINANQEYQIETIH